MAEIGIVANIIGIAGVVGQVTQGCMYLKSLINDVKDAPEEVRDLQKEVDLVSASITKLHTIYEQLTQSGTKPTIVNPVDEIQKCNEAVATLIASLKQSLDVFEDRTPTKVSSMKKNLHRLKYALGKETTKEKLNVLSRARLSLLVVQNNIELELHDHHAKFGRNMSHSIFKLRENTATTNHSLYKLEKAMDTSTAILNVNQQTTEAALSEISSIKATIGQVSANTTDTVAGVQRLEASVASLQDCISAATHVSAHSDQDLTKNVLQQIETGFSQAHPLLLAGFAQMLEAAFEKDRERSLASCRSMSRNESRMTAASSHFKDAETSTGVAGSGHLSFVPAATTRNITRYKIVSKTTYRTMLGCIIIQTLKPHKSSQEKSPDAYQNTPLVSIKKIELRIMLGILNRSFEFTCTRRKYNLGFEMSLRTRNIVRWNCPAVVVIEQWDLEATKKIFDHGEASIFDITENGYDYLYICLSSLHHYDVANDLDYEKLKAMVDYLIDSGIKIETTVAIHFDLMMLLSWTNECTLKQEYILQDIIRKILPHLSDWDTTGLGPHPFDQHNIHMPVPQLLLQQESLPVRPMTWKPVDWDYVILGENTRTMLLDPYGQQIKDIFNSKKGIIYNTYVVDRAHELVRKGKLELLQLLEFYIMRGDRTPELRFCCLNRLVLFLRHGCDPRKQAWVRTEEYPKKIIKIMTVTEFAAWFDASKLWEEALESAGWSAFDIMHLSDEDTYCGIPELLDGKVSYQTRKEFWEEIKAGFYDERKPSRILGHHAQRLFHDTCPDEKKQFIFWKAIKISEDIFAEKEKKMPGDWFSQEEWTLLPNDKARLDEAVYEVEEEFGYLPREDKDEESQDIDDVDEEGISNEDYDDEDADESKLQRLYGSAITWL